MTAVVGRLRADGSGSSPTELVLLMPVLLLIVLWAVQLALWLHARQVAAAAAQEGLATVQVETGTPDHGRQQAQLFLTEAGGVHQATVDAERGARTARVEVTGTVPAVIPGVSMRVSAVAEGPIEAFVPEPQR